MTARKAPSDLGMIHEGDSHEKYIRAFREKSEHEANQRAGQMPPDGQI